MDYSLTLPSGERLDGSSPVVVIGPNGSGKTRQTRNIAASVPVDFVNALRNTRVAPELPAMGFDTARNNFNNQRKQARSRHWEQTSEFDFMLSQLLAGDAMEAKLFTERVRENRSTAGDPPVTPLSRVEAIWRDVFPGRRLTWRDWKPVVQNTVGDASVEYSGNEMSDGERAALFVAGRVFSSDAGVLVVDEPETHFHSLLAVRLWNVLEDARPDLRFVYVTHDLTFALSRRDARYVLASPTAGLRSIDVDAGLPGDVAEALLGSASLSFYASRIVFCEGDSASLDQALYGAWFAGPDTVVRPVGSSEMVLRCVDALRRSGVAHSLEAIGLIDRDFHAVAFLEGLPDGVRPLDVHEVETLLALPEVVKAVADHLGRRFDLTRYSSDLRGTVNPAQERAIILRRWKAAVEPRLAGVVARVHERTDTLDALEADMPGFFDPGAWSFSPEAILRQERSRIANALSEGAGEAFLALAPGKQLVPVAARTVGMDTEGYRRLVIDALRLPQAASLRRLGQELVSVFERRLPARAAPISGPAAAVAPV
jgi:hypothetical protein